MTTAAAGGRSAADRTRVQSELARGQQPRQLAVDAGGPLLGVGSGASQGGAEGADGGERLAGLLSLGEVVAEVRDGERVVEVGGGGRCQRRSRQ